MKYKVSLDIFEGPLDLLLHLIREHELDIYDIPVSLVTEQYIKYIDFMKDLNLDIAGDFLVMAAELARIKSRMLLPSISFDEENPDNEIDPREELVKKLIEYKKYKEASLKLKEKELYHKEIFKREYFDKDTEIKEKELIDVSIFDIMNAFKEVMKKISRLSAYKLEFDEISVSGRMDEIMDIVKKTESIAFEHLFFECVKKFEIVATFLALLELTKQNEIKIYQTNQFGVLRIMKCSG